MRKLLFLVLALTVMAMPAMASVQNVKVSGDIENTYVVRDGFELGAGTFDQNAAIMQTRLRVDADLTDKVMATVALINEREWGTDNSTGDEIDLNLAYVVMKEMLYSPLTVTLGRQEFAFGNSFVIDSAGANNAAPTASALGGIAKDLTKQTAQDAIRLTLDYDPLTIDLLYSLLHQSSVTGTLESDNTYLYGVNAGYQFNDERGTLVEGYFWVKEDKTTAAAQSTIYMPGVRGSLNVLDGWNLQGEVAVQLGTLEASGVEHDRKAMAAQIISNYMLPFEKTEQYKPVFGTTYTYYSGDNDLTAGYGEDNEAWDPMYENQAGGKIYNTLFNATNCHILGANLAFAPMEDVMADVYFDYLVMDEKLTGAFGLVQPESGNVTPGQNDDKKLGAEVGVVVSYDYTEDVQFGARAGWFFPGDHYQDDGTASQLLLNAKVMF